MQMACRLFVVAIVVILCHHSWAAFAWVAHSRPLHDLDVLLGPLRNSPQPHGLTEWTGADSDASAAITDRHTLFIYGDTLVGGYTNNSNGRLRRVCAPQFGVSVCNGSTMSLMPRSSVGIWDRVTQRMRWYWRGDMGSFFEPSWATPNRIFWPIALSALHGDEIVAVGVEVLIDGHGAFGFSVNGTWAVKMHGVASTPTNPQSWPLEWSRIPFTGNLSCWNYSAEVEWRNGLLAVPNSTSEGATMNATGKTGHYYFYGTVTPSGDPGWGKAQVIARIPFSAMHGGAGFDWMQMEVMVRSSGHKQSTWWIPLADSGKVDPVTVFSPLWSWEIPELTIEYSPSIAQYLVVFTDNVTIRLRYSPRPEGPWSDGAGTPIGFIPAPYNQSGGFCYALKMHPSLNYLVVRHLQERGKDLWIFTYVCNTYRMEQLYEPGSVAMYLPVYNLLEIDPMVSN